MIELPEAIVLSDQINHSLSGKMIANVIAARSPHKFAWYFGDPQGYPALLTGRTFDKAVPQGGMIEITLDDDTMLLFCDGAGLRYYHAGEKKPDKHQLLIEFDDQSALVISVQMYGGLWAFKEGRNDNPYYLGAKNKPFVLSEKFSLNYFLKMMEVIPDTLSMKAALATGQRMPGLGNGVLQDILYTCGLHPKKKLKSLQQSQLDQLFNSIKTTLATMAFEGGRDTERDLFGCNGGYKTRLSKFTTEKPCSLCGNIIRKEAYMGGSIYYCPECQPL